MRSQIQTPAQAANIVDGLSRPVYYQMDLPVEDGREWHIWDASPEVDGYLVCPDGASNFILSYERLVDLVRFFSPDEITVRFYGRPFDERGPVPR